MDDPSFFAEPLTVNDRGMYCIDKRKLNLMKILK